MSLLFDANLPPVLVRSLADVFPSCEHVETIGLAASDREIWKVALEMGLSIVTKDSDFQTLAEVFAPPGKVVLVRLGNCGTKQIEHLIRWRSDQIRAFLADSDETLLVIP